MKFNHNPSKRRFERLSHMREFDVAPNEPDPRGWTVLNREGHAVGEVKDLIVDTDRMCATLLDVELDRRLFDLRGDDPHVMVPVERAHREGRRVVVDDVGPGWVSELRTAREMHDRDFWERWWQRGEPGRGTPITRRLRAEELNRALEDLRPGEAVRIPVAEEEIIVERRPIHRDEPLREDMVNRTTDEPPLGRR